MPSFTHEEFLELSLLRDKEIKAIISLGLLPKDAMTDPELHNAFVFEYPEMTLRITTGKSYPIEPLIFDVHNITLPRNVVDSLRRSLRNILFDDNHRDRYEEWVNRGTANETGILEFSMTALHMLQKTIAHLDEYRKDPRYWKAQVQVKPSKVDFRTIKHYTDILESEYGIDPATVEGHSLAEHALGKTPEEICEEIPPRYRILHIESIVRSDLYCRFAMRKIQIHERLMELPMPELRRSVHSTYRRDLAIRDSESERKALVDHLVTPRVTYHGTQRNLVPLIVRTGFLRPGDVNPADKTKLITRCGSTYGRGIYSSPSAPFSLCYSQGDARPTKSNEFYGLKLIVCATVMGIAATMSREDEWRTQHEAWPGADSHTTYSQLEYIVFDRAQILPCYVIHLDWGRDNMKEFYNIPLNSQAWVPHQHQRSHSKLTAEVLAPGDKRRLKEALVAKAAKYFPYGYGPATGTKFVVEEVGEIDEDEEEYGEYQKDRVEGIDGGGNNIWAWEKSVKGLDLGGEGDDGKRGNELEGEEDDGEANGDAKAVEQDDAWKWQPDLRGCNHFDEYFDSRVAKSRRR
ncbi:hypothetical protein MMC12_004335 [Toensbergia leucococca]|nr:hypothetical protein [Toensbergia leucococca]